MKSKIFFFICFYFLTQQKIDCARCDTALTPSDEKEDNQNFKDFLDGIVDDVSKNSTTVTCDDGSPCKLHFESDIYWDIRFSLYDKFVNPDNTITFSPSFYDCECTHGNDKNDFNDCMKALRTEMLNEYKKQIQDSKFNCYSYESNCDSS